MPRALLVCLFLALAVVQAGNASAQTPPPAANTGLDADRAKSNALTPEQRNEAQSFFREAFNLSRAGQFAQARAAFERGLSFDPANIDANFFLAQTLQQLNDSAGARTLYNKVIALDSNSPRATASADAIKALAASALPPAPVVFDLTRPPAPIPAEQENLLKAKDTFKECEQCPEMVVVPAGNFVMGSDKEEDGRINNEEPQHKVTFAQPFAAGKFAVTFDEWDACVADGGCNNYRPLDKGWGRGKQPVIYVSWNDAQNYVAWISKKTGKTYRLLSEAEWEYVARAGTTTPFWWGAELSTKLANYNGNYSYKDGPKGEDRRRTMPVDSLFPNPWGLYQVHGNILEWTQDCWHKDYNGAPEDGTAWTAGDDCKFRFIRGGAWDSLPADLRAARRENSKSQKRIYATGFRVARSIGR